MDDVRVYCSDEGYVACVVVDGISTSWKDLPEEVRDVLRSKGLVGLDEWTAMKLRVDAI